MASSTTTPSSSSMMDIQEDEGHNDKCNIKFHKAELPLLLMISSVANLVATVILVSLLKRLKSKNLLLLTFLAVNDLFSSIVLLISILTNTMTCDKFRQNLLCDILGWLGISGFGLSIFLIGIINLERMLMVGFPIFYHNHVTVNKILILFIMGEGISLVLGGLPLVNVGAPFIYYEDNRFCGFDWSSWNQNNSSHAILVLFNALYMLSVILFIASSNMVVLTSLRKRQQRLAAHTITNTLHGHLASEKFSLLTKVVAAFNCVCNLPFFVKLLVEYANRDRDLQGVEDSITIILLFCTPIINPFLYLIFNKLYREVLMQVLRKVFHCQLLCKTRVRPEGTDGAQLESSNIHTDVTNVASSYMMTGRSPLPPTSQSKTLQVTLHV